VIKVYDVVTDADRPWIVMELLEAISIAEAVRDIGLLPPRRAAEIGLAVLGALDAAHRVGVLHRDVKPANVLLCHDGRIVLTDFGVARGPGDSQLTSTGLLLGSPQYIAPERARGQSFGPPSDLWSLGTTLFAAVEGRSPFDRGDPLQTMTAVVAEPYDPPEHAENLAPVLDGLLRKDPAARWDVQRVRAGLRSVLSTPAVTVGPPPSQATPSRRTVPRLRSGSASPVPATQPTQPPPGLPVTPVERSAAAEFPGLVAPGATATMVAALTAPPLRPPAAGPAPSIMASGPTGTRPVQFLPATAAPMTPAATPADHYPPSFPGTPGRGMPGAPDPTGFGSGAAAPAESGPARAGWQDRLTGRHRRRWLLLAAAAVVIALVATIGTVVALTGDSPRPTASPSAAQAPQIQTVRYADPRGFSLDVPTNWQQRGRAPDLIRFYQPDNRNAFVQVYVNAAVGTAGPAGVFQAGENRLQRPDSGTQDYQRIRIENTTIGGYDGAVWEFTSTNPKDGTRKHTFDFGTVRPNGKSYEFYVTGPAADADRTRALFEHLITSLKFQG
jgi:hypothetical protein